MGGSGCQKSRLNLWLIERDTFLGWTSGKVGCSVWWQTSAVLPLSLPLGQSATIRLCLLFFLLVARPVPHQPRTCSTSTRFGLARAPSLTPRSRADFLSRHLSDIFHSSHFLKKSWTFLSTIPKFTLSKGLDFSNLIHLNLNNIEHLRVGTTPIRSTMSPRESRANERDRNPQGLLHH